MTTTLLPGLLKAVARNAGRGNTDLALFEAATVTLPRATGPAPIFGVDRRPTEGQLDELDKALPDQPLHLGLVVSGDRERAGWWGEGRQATWADAVDGVRRDGRGPRCPGRPSVPRHGRPGTPAAARRSSSATPSSVTPASCTRGCARRTASRPATAAAEIDLTRLLEHAVMIVGAPEFSDFPVAKEDVALVVDDVGRGRGRRGGPARGRGGVPRVGPALRRLHRDRRSARARSRSPSPCASGLPTAR